ncbi:hypothetical protein ACFY3O_36370 [Streptomyces sp. NPDC001046]|uniref:hypothetical protein n=1 Tax=Streptomyces sp. NPDC001046 TaxID=3364543 RepID=UPI00369CBEC2
MFVIAALLPVLLVLMLFGLDALENFLFPQPIERTEQRPQPPQTRDTGPPRP